MSVGAERREEVFALPGVGWGGVVLGAAELQGAGGLLRGWVGKPQAAFAHRVLA